ncbi:probable cyclin-dependent serine/threonine-protein kinase DDB_G0292550 [Calliphora vicina]|uniref:probable cyclin-dependent serine/threonine-protein kinase DDB_G0292550 n=1 Tax=Calliphora vicina TaxID=7373 RepID=UPI00325BB268
MVNAEIKILDYSNSQIIPINTGYAKVQTGTFKLIHVIEPDNLQNLINKIHQTLNYNVSQSHPLYPFLSHEANQLQNHLNRIKPRIKRSLDFIGSAWKWIAGNPDHADFQIIEQKINNALENNNNRIKNNDTCVTNLLRGNTATNNNHIPTIEEIAPGLILLNQHNGTVYINNEPRTFIGTYLLQYQNTSRTIHIPGLYTRPKFRANTSKALASTTSNIPIQNALNQPMTDFTKNPQFMSMLAVYGSGNQLVERDTPEFQKLFEEFYSKILHNELNVCSSTPLIAQKPINQLENQTILNPNVSSNMSMNVMLSQNQNIASNVAITETSSYVHSSNVEESRLATVFNDVLLQNQLSSPVFKHHHKPKSSQKNKSIFKPYNRSVQGESSQNTSNDDSNIYKIDIFSNHANVLAAYSNLLKNTKLHSPESSTNSIAKLPMAMKDFHNDVKTFKATTPYVSSSSYVSTMQMRNQFPQQQCTSSPNVISPTKTLQEKLAERQKAYQLNECNTASATTSTKDTSCDDIIVLDD